MKQGFHGPIYATPATIDLCSILLPDSGHLQEEDAAYYNKTRASKHHPALPLYTLEEAQQCLTLFRPVNFGEAKQLTPRAVVPLCASRAHPRLGHGGDHAQLERQVVEAALYRRYRPCARQPDRARQSCALRSDRGRRVRSAGDGEHLRQSPAPAQRSPPADWRRWSAPRSSAAAAWSSRRSPSSARRSFCSC